MTIIESGSMLSFINALEGATLQQINAKAALQTRIDRKYVVPLRLANEVVASLSDEAKVLDINGHRGFAYESLYFDTSDLTSFMMAAHGRRRRFKVRHRNYVSSGERYLEVKTRGSRGSTVKKRIRLDDLATDAANAFIDDVFAKCDLDVRSTDLQPALRTAYERTTLFLPETSSRMTIDTALTWSDNSALLALDDFAIIETKSGSAPSIADRTLWAHGCRPTRISKYGTGLAALHSELPSNKWNRTLRRHFQIEKAS